MRAASGNRKRCPRDLASYWSCWVHLCCDLSLLAFRTPECRAPVLGEPPHDSNAACGLAFLAFAVVYPERVLEIAEFARGLAMVAQRRAAGLDGLVQHRVDRRDQLLGVVGGFSFPGCQRRG